MRARIITISCTLLLLRPYCHPVQLCLESYYYCRSQFAKQT